MHATERGKKPTQKQHNNNNNNVWDAKGNKGSDEQCTQPSVEKIQRKNNTTTTTMCGMHRGTKA
jgi:hypothetical protein